MWTTKKKINDVRNKLIGLCLNPGQVLCVASPQGEEFFAIPYVRISLKNGMPTFSYEEMGKPAQHTFYFKKDAFDYELLDTNLSMGIIEQNVPFRSVTARVPWKLIKSYAKHFPFVATDNYFHKNGDLIA